MNEADFQKWVIDLAHLRGWRAAHFRPATVRPGRVITPVGADGKGFPDLCMVRRDRILFAELKRSHVRAVSPDQAEWREAIGLTCAEMYVWNPSDRSEIEEKLK